MSKHARSAAVLPVDGVERATAEERTFPAVNPTDGEVLWQVPDAGLADVAAAAAAARRAAETSWGTDAALRTDVLRHLQAALRDRSDDLALLAATETGVPVALRDDHVDAPIAQLRVLHPDQEAGVAAVVTPATSPFAVASPRSAASSSPAAPSSSSPPRRRLAPLSSSAGSLSTSCRAGCSTSSPPATSTSRSPSPSTRASTRCPSPARRWRASGCSSRRGAPARPYASTSVARRRSSSPTTTTSARSSSAAAASVAANAGQGCRLPSTVVVPEHRYDEALAVAVAAMEQVAVGDPTDDTTLCGPLRSRVGRDRVLRYLALARSEGGETVLGGQVLDRPGWWVAPTVIGGLTTKSRLVREEVLGPVLMVVADHAGAG